MRENLVSPKIEALARALEDEPELQSGRHMLVLAEGDCETIAICSCGQSLGNHRPDVSMDKIGESWQRHAMGLRR